MSNFEFTPQLRDNFQQTYEPDGANYVHTTTVNHKGTVLAFAMTSEGRIFYTSLDLDHKDAHPVDARNWSGIPIELHFPNEVAQVGYGVADATPMPRVTTDGVELADNQFVAESDLDPMLSSTARFTAPVPFQVFSDNKHVFVFRQAIAGPDSRNVFELENGQSGRALLLNLGLAATASSTTDIELTKPLPAALQTKDKLQVASELTLTSDAKTTSTRLSVDTAANVEVGDSITFLGDNGPEVLGTVSKATAKQITLTSKSAVAVSKGQLITTSRTGEVAANIPEGYRSIQTSNNLVVHPGDTVQVVQRYVKDVAKQRVPIVNKTLLVDRFVMKRQTNVPEGVSDRAKGEAPAVLTLVPKLEVRYRRSRSTHRPQSAKDSLGVFDMEGNPFIEPTSELPFIDNMEAGMFTVDLVPTQVVGVNRWHFFAFDARKQCMNSWSILQSKDGLFNTMDMQRGSNDPLVPGAGEKQWEEKFKATGIRIEKPTEYASFTPTKEFCYSMQQSLTLAMQVRVDSYDGSPALLSNADWSSGKYLGITLALSNSKSGYWMLNITSNYDTAERDNTPYRLKDVQGGFIADGKWHHIAVVLHKEGLIELFQDGAFVVSQPPTEDTRYFFKAGTSWGIGQDATGNYPDQMKAEIADLRIWKTARSAEALVESLYNELYEDDALLFAIKDSNSTTLFNAVGKQNATIHGGDLQIYLDEWKRSLSTAELVPGELPKPQVLSIPEWPGNIKALSVTDNTDYVSIPSRPSFYYTATQALTIELEVMLTGDHYSDPPLVGNNNWESGSDPGFVLCLGKPDAGPDYWRINVVSDDGKSMLRDIRGGELKRNQWHHLAVMMHTNGCIEMYQDGKLVKTDARTDKDLKCFFTQPKNQNWCIAQDGTGTYHDTTGTAPAKFQGLITNVRFWNSARTKEQLKANRRKTPASYQDGLVACFDGEGLQANTWSDLSGWHYHGTLHGSAKEVSAFGTGASCGIASTLYYQQEAAVMGHSPEKKPLKRQQRLMLATTKVDGTRVFDFAIDDAGIPAMPWAIDELPVLLPETGSSHIGLPQVSIDLNGRATHAGFLPAVASNEPPALFEGAKGDVGLYYSDINSEEQLSVAYFSTLTDRALYELNTGLETKDSGVVNGEPLRLVAKTAGAHYNDLNIFVEKDPVLTNLLRLTITNANSAANEVAREVWGQLPADAGQIAKILNGTPAREQRAVGMVSQLVIETRGTFLLEFAHGITQSLALGTSLHFGVFTAITTEPASLGATSVLANVLQDGNSPSIPDFEFELPGIPAYAMPYDRVAHMRFTVQRSLKGKLGEKPLFTASGATSLWCDGSNLYAMKNGGGTKFTIKTSKSTDLTKGCTGSRWIPTKRTTSYMISSGSLRAIGGNWPKVATGLDQVVDACDDGLNLWLCGTKDGKTVVKTLKGKPQHLTFRFGLEKPEKVDPINIRWIQGRCNLLAKEGGALKLYDFIDGSNHLLSVNMKVEVASKVAHANSIQLAGNESGVFVAFDDQLCQVDMEAGTTQQTTMLGNIQTLKQWNGKLYVCVLEKHGSSTNAQYYAVYCWSGMVWQPVFQISKAEVDLDDQNFWIDKDGNAYIIKSDGIYKVVTSDVRSYLEEKNDAATASQLVRVLPTQSVSTVNASQTASLVLKANEDTGWREQSGAGNAYNGTIKTIPPQLFAKDKITLECWLKANAPDSKDFSLGLLSSGGIAPVAYTGLITTPPISNALNLKQDANTTVRLSDLDIGSWNGYGMGVWVQFAATNEFDRIMVIDFEPFPPRETWGMFDPDNDEDFEDLSAEVTMLEHHFAIDNENADPADLSYYLKWYVRGAYRTETSDMDGGRPYSTGDEWQSSNIANQSVAVPLSNVKKDTWYFMAFNLNRYDAELGLYDTDGKEVAIVKNDDIDMTVSMKTKVADRDSRTGYIYGESYTCNIFQLTFNSIELMLTGQAQDLSIWEDDQYAAIVKSGTLDTRLQGNEASLWGYWRFFAHEAGDKTGKGQHGSIENPAYEKGFVRGTIGDEQYAKYIINGKTVVEPAPNIGQGEWSHLAMVWEQSYALAFDGSTTQYLNAGTTDALNITKDLTLEVCLQWEGGLGGVLSKGTSGSGLPYMLELEESATKEDLANLVFSCDTGTEGGSGITQRFVCNDAVKLGMPVKISVVRKHYSGQTTLEDYRSNASGFSLQMYVNEIPCTLNEAPGTRELHVDKHTALNLYAVGLTVQATEGSLLMGNVSSFYGLRGGFNGSISEVRLWERALSGNTISAPIHGNERGLISWWRFNDNEGAQVHDAVSENTAEIYGARWITDPDAHASTLDVYSNGTLRRQIGFVAVQGQTLMYWDAKAKENVEIGENKFDSYFGETGRTYELYLDKITEDITLGQKLTLGSLKFTCRQAATESTDSDTRIMLFVRFEGIAVTESNETPNCQVDEVRIWDIARTPEELQDELFQTLKGSYAGLIAHYPFDDANNLGEDASGNGHHLLLTQASTSTDLPPLGEDMPQVVFTPVAGAPAAPQVPSTSIAAPAVAEYPDLQVDAAGNLGGAMKRAYSYIDRDGRWQLLSGFKVGNLVTEWLGQVQADPQLIGFIEGAPPVPSENLTSTSLNTGGNSKFADYGGASSVALNESDNVNVVFASSKEDGFDMAVKMTAGIGYKEEIDVGMGVEKMATKIDIGASFNGEFNMSRSRLQEQHQSYAQNQGKSTSMALNGAWEAKPADVAAAGQLFINDYVGKRFVPYNEGFALVQSDTMDMFALRLEHNNALVAYRMFPNPDIPKDVNIITFPINPEYTKQGTLDGKVGLTGDFAVQPDPQYPNAASYGEYSYFKPREAYSLKKQLEKEREQLQAMFDEYDASIGPKPRFDQLQQKVTTSMVNTYVWTAKGGFYAETNQSLTGTSQSNSGRYNFSGKAGLHFKASTAVFGPTLSFEGDALFGNHLVTVKTKSRTEDQSFGVSVKCDPDGDLQYYRNVSENAARDLEEKLGIAYLNEGNGGYDAKGKPVLRPGKVDAYRFMTFYLEPEDTNFDDFFGKVIDPIWIAQSSDWRASALRQANQGGKKPACWRIMHRVTYVSRVHPPLVPETRTSLASVAKTLNIESNYELIKFLEPHVKVYVDTNEYVNFTDAIHYEITQKMPELLPHLDEIVRYMCDYFGMYPS